ncbi:hypothetical protein D8674_019284 [Pyrus ussuriensis x Pyrus communis]|uniref:Uncharacterized protein n=1 Tax=Pyrus ussuriensis x Pyrus communis TaxID=2448454 RepID=A0A5N5GCS3_9ROSA|nr:hypothetical protein D8674_019284 [Pyrus ussuriensis x Pyrus communis]
MQVQKGLGSGSNSDGCGKKQGRVQVVRCRCGADANGRIFAGIQVVVVQGGDELDLSAYWVWALSNNGAGVIVRWPCGRVQVSEHDGGDDLDTERLSCRRRWCGFRVQMQTNKFMQCQSSKSTRHAIDFGSSAARLFSTMERKQ